MIAVHDHIPHMVYLPDPGPHVFFHGSAEVKNLEDILKGLHALRESGALRALHFA